MGPKLRNASSNRQPDFAKEVPERALAKSVRDNFSGGREVLLHQLCLSDPKEEADHRS